MKLCCSCGHVIVDQTDNLAYKGYLFKDLKTESFLNAFNDIIKSFVYAMKIGKIDEWRLLHFPSSNQEIRSESSMLIDLIDAALQDLQHVYECENCGIIHIEIGQEYKTYKPISHIEKKVLNEDTETL